MVEWTRRLAYIEEKFGEALADKALARESGADRFKSPRQIIEHMAEADPSPNKSATQWLVNAYLRDGFLLEDLDRARRALLLFGRSRRRLPAEARDLGKYSTLPDLEDVIEPFVVKAVEDDTTSGKSLKRQDKERARAESVILYEGDDGLTVAVPMTEFASKWWGKGTRWCTAGDDENMFERYHHKAPLIVIIMPGGEKLQVWAWDFDRFQFMDAADRSVSDTYIEENANALAPILKWLGAENDDALKAFMKSGRMSLDDARMVVARKPDWFPQVIDRLAFELDEPSVHALVSSSPKNTRRHHWIHLRDIPERFRSDRVVMEVVSRAGCWLGLIEKPSRELCLAAVINHGEAIKFVPRDMLDREIILAAVQSWGGAFMYLEANWRKDPEIMAVAATNYGLMIRHMHHPLPRELYLSALKVKNFQDVWEEIPDSVKDRDFLLEAVKVNGNLISSITGNADIEIRRAAAMQTGYMLGHLPEKFRDKEVCLAAVRSASTTAFKNVPADIMDDDIRMALVENFGTCGMIPDSEMTTPLLIAELKQNRKMAWSGMLEVYANEPELRELAVSLIVDEFNNCGRRPEDREYKTCPELVDLVPKDAPMPTRWDVADLAGLRQALEEAFQNRAAEDVISIETTTEAFETAGPAPGA